MDHGRDDYLDWIHKKNNTEEAEPGSLKDCDATPVAAACIGIATSEVRCVVAVWTARFNL